MSYQTTCWKLLRLPILLNPRGRFPLFNQHYICDYRLTLRVDSPPFPLDFSGRPSETSSFGSPLRPVLVICYLFMVITFDLGGLPARLISFVDLIIALGLQKIKSFQKFFANLFSLRFRPLLHRPCSVIVSPYNRPSKRCAAGYPLFPRRRYALCYNESPAQS